MGWGPDAYYIINPSLAEVTSLESLRLLAKMSPSPECYEEKTGHRDGGALARQRRLICGLFIWSTLLTLGLATCVVFQFFNGASLDFGKHEKLSMSASSTQSPDTVSR